MVKTKDEILKAIKERVGEDTSDETIAFLEDVTDTLNDYENKTNADTDWKTKYEENDKEWRKRYTDRFFNNGDEGDVSKGGNAGTNTGGNNDEDDEPDEPTTFEELFKEGE